jgi:hypothetical protein
MKGRHTTERRALILSSPACCIRGMNRAYALARAQGGQRLALVFERVSRPPVC